MPDRPAAARALGWVGLGAVLAGAVAIPFFLAGESLEAALRAALATPAGSGITALLVVAALALDIVLPVPSSLVATAAGAALGWPGGAAASCAGLTLGCWLGYALGRTASPLALRLVGAEGNERLQRVLERYGIAALVVLRAVPVLAEASVLLAGVGRMPAAQVLGAALLANAGLSLAYAALGAWAAEADSFALGFAGAVVLPALAYALARAARRRAA